MNQAYGHSLAKLKTLESDCHLQILLRSFWQVAATWMYLTSALDTFSVRIFTMWNICVWYFTWKYNFWDIFQQYCCIWHMKNGIFRRILCSLPFAPVPQTFWEHFCSFSIGNVFTHWKLALVFYITDRVSFTKYSFGLFLHWKFLLLNNLNPTWFPPIGKPRVKMYNVFLWQHKHSRMHIILIFKDIFTQLWSQACRNK